MNDSKKVDRNRETRSLAEYILPDGTCLTTEQMEARLRESAESAKSPEESEEANLRLAHFFLGEARPLLALPILEAIRESTGDKKARAACDNWVKLMRGRRKRPPTERAKKAHLAMLIRLGAQFAGWGDRIAALTHFERAIALAENPLAEAALRLEMGKLCEQFGDYRTAVEYYSKTFALRQGEDETWYFLNNNLGYALSQIGRHAEAERYCRRAIKIDPSRHNAHKNLGLSLRGQGRYREAAASFVQAARLGPGDNRAMGHLEEMFECRPELYRELFGIEHGGLEQLRRAIEGATRQSWC